MNNSILQKSGLPKIVSSKVFPSSKGLNKVAKDVGLIKRVRLVTAPMFLFAMIQAVAFSERSCRSVALALGIQGDVRISRQAVWKMLKKPAVIPFLEEIIGRAVTHSMKESSVLRLAENTAGVLKGVTRILVGDASSLTLHPKLTAFFAGTKNQTNAMLAQLKLQLCVDLITGKIVHFSLDVYRRSDTKAAFDILPFLQKGDLLIRDLGFSSALCFEAIASKGAFFLSRLKADYTVFDVEGKQIDLIEKLRRSAPNAGMIIRLPIQITALRFGCQLVAIRVPEEVASERRRKLKQKAKKAGKPNPRKETLERQNWTLLITNLPQSTADDRKIQELYLLRWRIEMIFKAAKSHSGLLVVARHYTNKNHARALILAWVLMVIMLASLGSFALGRLKEVYCPVGGSSFELKVHNESLFKSFQKRIYMLGFHLELMGCGGNPMEHFRRTECYSSIHNTTELTPCRTALSEILASVLDLGCLRLS